MQAVEIDLILINNYNYLQEIMQKKVGENHYLSYLSIW